MAHKFGWTTKSAGATIRDIAVMGLCAAILIAVQVAMAPIPNIELVSLLVIVYTLAFGPRVLYIVYIFALAEGLIYGFSLWWIPYLYVWTILAFVTWLLRGMRRPLGWAILSGAFGLLFGALCTIINLFIGGLSFAISWWVSGIPFDLIHCAGNFVLCLVLWKPMNKLLTAALLKH